MSEWPQFRAQARSFHKQALEARRSGEREELLMLARQWEQLADEVERAERHLEAPRPRRGTPHAAVVRPV
jgi:hypothetical protein